MTPPRERAGASEPSDRTDRPTDELVIGVVGPIGAGVSKTASLLADFFKQRYKYNVSCIRISDLIMKCASLVDEEILCLPHGHERTSKLQEIGSKLRKRFSECYLAEKCVELIARERLKGNCMGPSEDLVQDRTRKVYIIKSLKNPAEVELLRQVYGDAFWLFGIFAPREIREERLKRLGFGRTELDKIMTTDEEEGVDHGQRVRKTIQKSDFFIRNDRENDDRLKLVITRYLEMLFNVGVRTPMQDELAMYTATSAAAASACLSRQVGAAIYSASGELIGIGSNDVPKKGGSLYSTEDGDHDHRCYKWREKICHNDRRKDQLYRTIYKSLTDKRLISSKANFESVKEALKNTEIKNLIEYSRAVHAEMEAIMSVARGHKQGIVGATMYTTVFPCHSCARHIVASGIQRVIYIEPYPKSLARELHEDAISVSEQDDSSHVLFLQYEGVAPKNIMRLFGNEMDRKGNGELHARDTSKISPAFPSPLGGFGPRERIIINRLRKMDPYPARDRNHRRRKAAMTVAARSGEIDAGIRTREEPGSSTSIAGATEVSPEAGRTASTGGGYREAAQLAAPVAALFSKT